VSIQRPTTVLFLAHISILVGDLLFFYNDLHFLLFYTFLLFGELSFARRGVLLIPVIFGNRFCRSGHIYVVTRGLKMCTRKEKGGGGSQLHHHVATSS